MAFMCGSRWMCRRLAFSLAAQFDPLAVRLLCLRHVGAHPPPAIEDPYKKEVIQQWVKVEMGNIWTLMVGIYQ